MPTIPAKNPKFADKNQNATLLRGSGNPKSTLKKLVAVGKNLSRIQSSKEHKLANIQILTPLPIESEAINSIHLLFLILKYTTCARDSICCLKIGLLNYALIFNFFIVFPSCLELYIGNLLLGGNARAGVLRQF